MLSRESTATAVTSPRYPSGGSQIRRSSWRVHSAVVVQADPSVFSTTACARASGGAAPVARNAIAVVVYGSYRAGCGPAGRRKVGERLRPSADYSVIEEILRCGIGSIDPVTRQRAEGLLVTPGRRGNVTRVRSRREGSGVRFRAPGPGESLSRPKAADATPLIPSELSTIVCLLARPRLYGQLVLGLMVSGFSFSRRRAEVERSNERRAAWLRGLRSDAGRARPQTLIGHPECRPSVIRVATRLQPDVPAAVRNPPHRVWTLDARPRAPAFTPRARLVFGRESPAP